MASLVVGSLSAPARELVAERFEAIADTLEARRNPFVFDLEELDVERTLADSRPAVVPMITAASRLAGSHFPLDEERSVRLETVCSRGEICVPVWGSSAHPDAARARFAAWPVSHGLVLRARDENTARLASVALRLATAERRTPIALVVDAESTTLAPESALRVAKAAERCVRLLRDHPDDARLLAPLAADARPPRLDHLGLRRDEILVVPKLGALAEPGRFREVVLDRLAAGGGRAGVDFRSEE